MHTVIQDLRYGWRQLQHAREFTFLAVMMLALGIGANTAMFTVVESVLLRPLPYRDADRLVNIGAAEGDSSGSVSWLDYGDIRDQARTLDAAAGYSNDVGVVEDRDSSLSIVTSEVTPNLFEILGVQPLRGRTFAREEGQTGGPQVVVLSEGIWRKAFGADPAIVGRAVRVNGRERTVVGVMPGGFRFPESAGPGMESGLWLPMQPTPEMLKDRGYHFFAILARPARRAGVSQVQLELRQIAKRIRDTDAQADRTLSFHAASYKETVTGPVRPVFWALVAALALGLLIACANVANLLVARCLGRQHEFAVRVALGSGRMRLIRQMTCEAALLSLLGCALGLLVAYGITAAVHKLPPGTIPRAETIQVRWTVLLALASIAKLTTVLSALLPAMFVARTDPQVVLRASSRSLGTRMFSARVGSWLVTGEVALSVLLLIATGLLFRTLWSLEHARLGFDAARVTSFTAMPADASGFGNMTVTAPGAAPASVALTVYQPLLEGIRHAAGVSNVALVTAPPLSGVDLRTSFRVLGWPADAARGCEARLSAQSGGYERVMGTAVVRGRSITELDTANAPFVATVNEAFARRYFPFAGPLGQRLDLGGSATGMLKPYTIVGVVGDQIDAGARQSPQPLLMLPYQQIPPSSLFYPALLQTVVHFVVKSHGDVEVAPAVRAVFHQTARDLALDNFQTMQQAVDRSNFGARLGFYLIAAFAGLAVLMVIAGVYSVLGQVVSCRRREFGLRMALGATRQGIAGRMLLRASASVALGLAAGIVLALSTGRLIGHFLYGVKPLDGATYGLVIVALLGVGALAALLPSWRAASVEVVTALRDE
jgi:putative ABC transport system permease protein